MLEALREKPDINFGGKSLFGICRYFKNIGWKENPGALKSLDGGTLMIQGNCHFARFLHVLSIFEGRDHEDILELSDNQLIRHCPTYGNVTVFSTQQILPQVAEINIR